MLKDWPEGEKPREKLLSLGAASLSDAELLAIFLRTGVNGCDVVELARHLLANFGSIAAIYRADQQAFCQVRGIGAAKYAQLQACLEMTKRYLAEEINSGVALTSSAQSKQFLLSQLRNETNEVFAVLFLDSQHQVIRFEKVFHGTLNASAVYPRVVLEKALNYNAGAVILAHNHPSGVAEASISDKQITQRLQQALALVEINVLDHMIVAGHQCFSFAEHGLIN
ncbi:DNA repair protein RadC [Thalassotalea sp. G2M2-11]|uniref:RadC family protein n=1 Tax=Thalassotalea sp. G2M2-11 TaxID=2787627 RepID=UPI0019CFDFFE|nr:DNA repair protein RadC [Thalassotalea sp. G2M2-11]